MIELVFAAQILMNVVCAPLTHIHQKIAGDYGERRIGHGVQDGHIVEIWVSPHGTWTIISVPPDPRRNACIMMAGKAYRPPPPTEHPL